MEAPANMVFIPPGTFWMGSPADELDRFPGEDPLTAVPIMLDVVSGNEGARSVSVFLGRGDGTFGERRDYPIENATGPVTKPAAADFNGDRQLDLAVATYDSFVAVMLGNGDGIFASSGSRPGPS